jgi:hypothetical protein
MVWGSRIWKKLISMARGTTKKVKKNHGLGAAGCGKNSYPRVEGLQNKGIT